MDYLVFQGCEVLKERTAAGKVFAGRGNSIDAFVSIDAEDDFLGFDAGHIENVRPKIFGNGGICI